MQATEELTASNQICCYILSDTDLFTLSCSNGSPFEDLNSSHLSKFDSTNSCGGILHICLPLFISCFSFLLFSFFFTPLTRRLYLALSV